jgi:hypothetical protein
LTKYRPKQNNFLFFAACCSIKWRYNEVAVLTERKKKERKEEREEECNSE